ncbi:hypothetical protein PC9H_010874 [Pleurotus ostreatus]|uniref:Uncharacterized protein n=2 Tax=Pleurotus TaxID=5320 RepID=A0A8H6ZPJ6_PLEOS|nr:uncharacterized protein PC9H_010874 [Pleurotus ostreatus]KAF7422718.1 hypothetical protein PC9H_010874 [Pleurotus ostreatus]KAG9227435.1 hypothetical protein CCMSSC00406_0000919 [Pleurotus cornucopiae]KAJ8691378.1 hypothetical protein PTI98_010961 [Pleurotus ostreatus]
MRTKASSSLFFCFALVQSIKAAAISSNWKTPENYAGIAHGMGTSEHAFAVDVSSANADVRIPQGVEVGGSVVVRYSSDITRSELTAAQVFHHLVPRNKAEGKEKPAHPRNVGYAIVIGAVAGLIFLIAMIAVSCHCFRKHRMQSKVASISMSMPKSKSKGGGPASGGVYARLPDPEPVDRPAGTFQQPHYDPNVPYATPWSPPSH